MNEYIAIIPARGGSKGIKDKNLQLVGNKSLIGRAIESAQKVKQISRIIVSTDSDKITNEALKYGAEVHKRSDASASDTAKTIEVMSEIYQDYNFNNEVCVLLQPTSPLRNSQHILDSIQKYEKNKQEGSVITVTECEHHPFKSVILDNKDGYKPIRDIVDLESPRQGLEKAFRINGAVYIVAFKDLLQRDTFFVPPQLFVEMSAQCSIDIDSHEDLEKANLLLSKEN